MRDGLACDPKSPFRKDYDRVPIYEVLFDYRLPDEERLTRGAAFIAADSVEHAEQVLRTKSQFRRAAELKVSRMEEKPSGFVLGWNVYPRGKIGGSAKG